MSPDPGPGDSGRRAAPAAFDETRLPPAHPDRSGTERRAPRASGSRAGTVLAWIIGLCLGALAIAGTIALIRVWLF